MAWLVARGLLDDLSDGLKNFANARSAYGLLWTQDVIAPLTRVGHLALVVGAVYLLLRLWAGGQGEVLLETLDQWMREPLFQVGGAGISARSIVIGILGLVLVVWLAQWVRGVTYRWVYGRFEDQGVRHSLSVFTQYAVVVIGVVIALNVAGVDLTAFTVFAGALGVGLGFGMQNIANNFVSGILLLAERPLRTGDTVKIGASEGEVTRIGIRSLTVNTWDNQQVIIPNAEVISGSFTNWTRNDNILRSVLMVGVSYQADPEQVEALLQEVLEADRAVLLRPPPEVFLWEFGDSAVNFRVQYFIDIGRESLLRTRSRINHGVWKALKEAGVEIPFPQRDLHVRSGLPTAWPHPAPAFPSGPPERGPAPGDPAEGRG